MTLAIALTTHDDRTLEPGPTRFEAFLDNLPTNRRAPANEARIKASGTTAIMFGAFCLVPMQRLLLEASQPVHLGSRALDILIALVERHGELVTKQELISRVWPGIAVDETNVAVHISALRRVLATVRLEVATSSTFPGRATALSHQSRSPRNCRPRRHGSRRWNEISTRGRCSRD